MIKLSDYLDNTVLYLNHHYIASISLSDKASHPEYPTGTTIIHMIADGKWYWAVKESPLTVLELIDAQNQKPLVYRQGTFVPINPQ